MEKNNVSNALPELPRLESPEEKAPVEFTPLEEAALVRRLDWHVLPGLALLYFLCFLDRT
jgi:hypothetical protein